MIFIDAGAFIAPHRPSDDNHEASLRGWRKLAAGKDRCFTSNLVIAEAATLLARIAGGTFASQKVEQWYDSGSITILRSDEDIERRAGVQMARFADQEVGFVDCVSFELMKLRRVSACFRL